MTLTIADGLKLLWPTILATLVAGLIIWKNQAVLTNQCKQNQDSNDEKFKVLFKFKDECLKGELNRHDDA